MTAQACREVLENAAHRERAPALDAAHPHCVCEAWSLSLANDNRFEGGELVARILTAPGDYDEESQTVLTARLCDLYSCGLSVIRAGASDEEILDTINQLTIEANGDRTLLGAVVVSVEEIRQFDAADRWFGVYATDDRGKSYHGDVMGVSPVGSKSAIGRAKSRRRHLLAASWNDKVLFSDIPLDLLAQLRTAGI